MAQDQQTEAVGRAPAAAQALPGRVALTESTLGGYMVIYSGALVGWLQSDGERWIAYAPATPPTTGKTLGSFDREDRAVRRILSAAGVLSRPAGADA